MSALELETVVRGGLVATAEAVVPADVGIVGEQVTAVGRDLPRGSKEIDARGRIVAPGAIDVHTHFDHFVEFIGKNNADDYDSGTRAAAVGGITTVINFAFQTKGASLRAAVEHELSRAEGNAHVDYGIHLCITDMSVPGVLEELGPLADEGFPSVKVFTTVHTYQLTDSEVLRVLAACRELGMMVNVHAEDESLIRHFTDELLRDGRGSVEYLPDARPPVAEALATYKVASYARALGTPVYFVHLSCGPALSAVRRVRDDGGEVYVETRPVYLYLDQSRYGLPNREGNKYVCLPPLRAKSEQRALWAGLSSGEIQTYATDHAPWTSDAKLDPSRVFSQLPAGVSNVQTSIGMLFAEGVQKKRISLSRMVQVTSTNPAKLFGMWPRKGTIVPGADADLVVFDPERSIRISGNSVLGVTMQSKADYDPYEGYEGFGWPVVTLLRGTVVAEEGRPSGEHRGRFIRRRRFERL